MVNFEYNTGFGMGMIDEKYGTLLESEYNNKYENAPELQTALAIKCL